MKKAFLTEAPGIWNQLLHWDQGHLCSFNSYVENANTMWHNTWIRSHIFMEIILCSTAADDLSMLRIYGSAFSCFAWWNTEWRIVLPLQKILLLQVLNWLSIQPDNWLFLDRRKGHKRIPVLVMMCLTNLLYCTLILFSVFIDSYIACLTFFLDAAPDSVFTAKLKTTP